MAILKTIYWDQKESGDLVYKYPNHEITLGSVLTVNESQEAFFFKNGTLYDSFKKGRYILSTSNLPLLNKIIDLPTGGDTTFLAEVWFVSKTDRKNLFWGTGGLRIIDPYFEIPLQLYGRGGYGVYLFGIFKRSKGAMGAAIIVEGLCVVLSLRAGVTGMAHLISGITSGVFNPYTGDMSDSIMIPFCTYAVAGVMLLFVIDHKKRIDELATFSVKTQDAVNAVKKSLSDSDILIDANGTSSDKDIDNTRIYDAVSKSNELDK